MKQGEQEVKNLSEQDVGQNLHSADIIKAPELKGKDSLFYSIEEAGQDIERRKRERDGKPLRQTAIIAREITRQSSKEKPTAVQGELFSFMSPDARKKAIVYNNEGKLLSALIDGIDGGELAYKVVIALAITLYEQSELYGTIETLTGATEMYLPLFGKKKITQGKNAGKLTAEGKYVESTCPIVYIDIIDFTKLAKGLDSRPSGRERTDVRAVLTSLREKKIFMPASNGKWIGTTIIGKEREVIDTNTKREILLLELDSIFTRMIKEDFAVIRKDTLRKLKGNQSKMTMRLLHYLLEQHSYHNPTCQIAKEALFNRIAIADNYKTHPKRRDTDFKEALKKMEDCKLIEPIITAKGGYSQKGGYYEATGANGFLYCHFKLNAKYTEDEAL